MELRPRGASAAAEELTDLMAGGVEAGAGNSTPDAAVELRPVGGAAKVEAMLLEERQVFEVVEPAQRIVSGDAAIEPAVELEAPPEISAQELKEIPPVAPPVEMVELALEPEEVDLPEKFPLPPQRPDDSREAASPLFSPGKRLFPEPQAMSGTRSAAEVARSRLQKLSRAGQDEDAEADGEEKGFELKSSSGVAATRVYDPNQVRKSQQTLIPMPTLHAGLEGDYDREVSGKWTRS